MRLDPPPRATSLAIGVAEPQNMPAVETALEDLEELRVDWAGSGKGGGRSWLADEHPLQHPAQLAYAGGRKNALDLGHGLLRPCGERQPGRGAQQRHREEKRDDLLGRQLGREQDRRRIELDATTAPDRPVDGKASRPHRTEVAKDGSYGNAQLPSKLVGRGVVSAAQESHKLLAPPADVHGLQHYPEP